MLRMFPPAVRCEDCKLRPMLSGLMLGFLSEQVKTSGRPLGSRFTHPATKVRMSKPDWVLPR